MSLLDRARGLVRRASATNQSDESFAPMRSAPDPTPPQEPPLFMQCVVGYRMWIADESDCLWPIGVPLEPWRPGVNTAECRAPLLAATALDQPPPHAVPDGDCHCGLYSWRYPRHEWFLCEDGADGHTVVGAVASWGRLQVHRTGIRAQHACVVALVHRPWINRDRAATYRIAARYGVEVVRMRDLEAAASRHGAPLPDALHDEIPIL